ncbi:MAG: hypothetical protein FH751_00455 [Firmicutes bacterium]|nr:hypothetical protein [Bacillota bacterium]
MEKKDLKEIINLFRKNIKIIEKRLEIQNGNLNSKKNTIDNFKKPINLNKNEDQTKKVEKMTNDINESIKKNIQYTKKLTNIKDQFDLLYKTNPTDDNIDIIIKKINDDILYLTEKLKIETNKNSKRSTEIQKLFEDIIKI